MFSIVLDLRISSNIPDFSFVRNSAEIFKSSIFKCGRVVLFIKTRIQWRDIINTSMRLLLGI